jgi:hypothetical protein
MDMCLGGVKAGYVHQVKEEAEFLNRPAVGYKTETHMKMSGLVVVRKSCVMEIDYVDGESSPLGFVKVFKSSGTKDRIVEGAVQEGELKIEVREGDEVAVKTLELPDTFLFDDVAGEKLRASGYQTEDGVSFVTIDEDVREFFG